MPESYEAEQSRKFWSRQDGIALHPQAYSPNYYEPVSKTKIQIPNIRGVWFTQNPSNSKLFPTARQYVSIDDVEALANFCLKGVEKLSADLAAQTTLLEQARIAITLCIAEIRRLGDNTDRLLNHCPENECSACASIVCPHGEPLHLHHDGCPACAQDEDGEHPYEKALNAASGILTKLPTKEKKG